MADMNPVDAETLIITLRNDLGTHCVLDAADPQYNANLDSYFSKFQSNTRPIAILKPETVGAVSTAVKRLSEHFDSHAGQPLFAVRSGGITPFQGASNIAGGFTVDLRALNQITISADRSTIVVGAGCTWGAVYASLDGTGYSVPGGRGLGIGVGGLTLGGGISYFSPRTGFVCDSVSEFEVVVAGGGIVKASKTEHPRLWRALKGGSNNFGIVTAFAFELFPCDKIWGGQRYYEASNYSAHLDAISQFALSREPDDKATIITSIAHIGAMGGTFLVESLQYTAPVEDPPAFAKFLDIPVMKSTSRIATLTELITEQSAFVSVGHRQTYMTTSIVCQREALDTAYDAFDAKLPALKPVRGITWALVYQPIAASTIKHGQNKGGNVLCLEGSPPIINVSFMATWDDEADDELIMSSIQGAVADIEEAAKKAGAFHPFKYLNYCWHTQDPIEGYGRENRSFLQAVSQEYDPIGLFQTGCPGGFKLFGQSPKT